MLHKILGLKVKALRGYNKDKRVKSCEAEFILFDDGKTFIRLEEQDYYSYHDCNGHARELVIEQDTVQWKRLMYSKDYRKATFYEFHEFKKKTNKKASIF